MAAFTVTPAHGAAPLRVELDASASEDPDGAIVSWEWSFPGGTASGARAAADLAAAGCHAVQLTVTDDGGATATASRPVVVTAGPPSGAPQVLLAGLPRPGAVLPRDLATDQGELHVTGSVASPGYHAVALRVLDAAGAVVDAATQPLCAGEGGAIDFDLTAHVPAALVSHRVIVALLAPGPEVEVASVADVVAGDVFLVQGQSNAVAAAYSGDANVDRHPFLRSFGTRAESSTTTQNDTSWHQAEGNAAEGPGAVGQWSLRLGRLLLDRHQVPIAILNGARGGQPIGYFQRNDASPADLATNYGRLLWRARSAGVDGGVRAILFYQGESDGANAAGHHDGWIALHADWLVDFPGVERTYVTQVRVGCGAPSTALREVQRHFADELPDVGVMSTTGLDGHDGCHFAYANGYRLLGERYAALVGRDLYGDAGAEVGAPNPARAAFSRADGTQITVVLRDAAATTTWQAGAETDWVLEGTAVTVRSATVAGASLILELGGDARAATGLSYNGHSGAGRWIVNGKGIGLLSFSSAIGAAP